VSAPAAIFYAFAALAVASATMVIRSRNAVHSAIALVVSFLSVAGIYVLLEAEFVAAVQVLVYAGGIMVLFLFVIMLVNLRDVAAEKLRLGPAVGGTVGVFLLVAMLAVYGRGHLVSAGGEDSILRQGGNLQAVGEAIFSTALLPFEIASVLLLVAMVGVIVLAGRFQRS
jgi:NADH-quinone oxidoreductase subunit J